MSNALLELSASDLSHAAGIKSQIETLEAELASILSGAGVVVVAEPIPGMKPKRTMSPAARARIAAGQKARWAKIKTVSPASMTPSVEEAKRTMSLAARARIAASQKARWAKVRAAKKGR
jgi:hypothetical protein